jgi:hypothetical protein
MPGFDKPEWPTLILRCGPPVRLRSPPQSSLLGGGVRGGTLLSVDKYRSGDNVKWAVPPCSCDEISDRDGFVAVWAGSAGTNTFAKSSALRAALLAEVARIALRAHVHSGEPWRACW